MLQIRHSVHALLTTFSNSWQKGHRNAIKLKELIIACRLEA
jgi:hypothetical protein